MIRRRQVTRREFLDQSVRLGAISALAWTGSALGQGQAGAQVVNNYITQHFYDEGAAALGMAVVRNDSRNRLNSSMGR